MKSPLHHYPQLRALFESRQDTSVKTRSILIALIILFGILAASSRGGVWTWPFVGLITVIVVFFKKIEHRFDSYELQWQSFIVTAKGTPLEHLLPQLEEELSGGTIEWTHVMITENFILWPRDIHRGKISLISNISLLHLGSFEGGPFHPINQMGHQFMCDTRNAGERLTLSLDVDESQEIFNELRSREPDISVTQDTNAYFNPTSVSVDDE